MSFINNQEKMVDFFQLHKENFLSFYSYLSSDEYEETKREVLERSGYCNADIIAEDKGIDGVVVGKIIQSLMMIEWLERRC